MAAVCIPKRLSYGYCMQKDYVATNKRQQNDSHLVYLIAKSEQLEETLTATQIAVPESEREIDLERYLQEVEQTQHYCESTISSIDGEPSTLDPEGYSDEDDGPCEPERLNLINLDEVKKFIVESGAYSQFRTSFRSFLFPPQEVVDVESRRTDLIKSATPIPYRLLWICSYGHENYDFIETIPGSMTRLADLLQANGIQSQLEICPTNSAFLELYNIIGVAWAANKKSIQDEFAVATYILALEALIIGTVQMGIGSEWI
ncbi:hypothetical protein L13192_06847 [Pyrenophora tritici-repentis]|nr:hypothetical protein L13192_06847 [Pyrenophora tritici-repentis]